MARKNSRHAKTQSIASFPMIMLPAATVCTERPHQETKPEIEVRPDKPLFTVRTKTNQRRTKTRSDELIKAALKVFAEKGFTATRLDDIAAAVGISKGTVYLYFSSKEALFQAAVREGLSPLFVAPVCVVDDATEDTGELIAKIVTAWWRTFTETSVGDTSKILISESCNFPELTQCYWNAINDRGHTLIRHALERGIVRGEVRPIDIESVVELVFAPLMVMALWRQSFGNLDADSQSSLATEDFVRSHLDLVLNGLRP